MRCASGSVVEYRLAKARVAGSNPVSRLSETGFLIQKRQQDLSFRKLNKMREWLSGGVSPCQGEGRGFESRLALSKKQNRVFCFFVFVLQDRTAAEGKAMHCVTCCDPCPGLRCLEGSGRNGKNLRNQTEKVPVLPGREKVAGASL